MDIIDDLEIGEFVLVDFTDFNSPSKKVKIPVYRVFGGVIYMIDDQAVFVPLEGC